MYQSVHYLLHGVDLGGYWSCMLYPSVGEKEELSDNTVGCHLHVDSNLGGRGCFINNMDTVGGFGRVLVSHIISLSWEERGAW